jgi:hypothetical protein
MCTAELALAGQAAGAAQSTVGSIASAVQTRAALRSQARILDINAGMVEDAARQTRVDGQTMGSRRYMEGERLRSSQVAAMAGNNIVVGEGSSAAVLASTEYGTEVDVKQIEANAIRQALGLKTEAGNLRSQATTARAQASGISPFMEGLGSALTGATAVAGTYYNLNKAGAFDKGPKIGSVNIPQLPNTGRVGHMEVDPLRSRVDSISPFGRSGFKPKVTIYG